MAWAQIEVEIYEVRICTLDIEADMQISASRDRLLSQR